MFSTESPYNIVLLEITAKSRYVSAIQIQEIHAKVKEPLTVIDSFYNLSSIIKFNTRLIKFKVHKKY